MGKSIRGINKNVAKLVMAHMYVAFTALFIGATAGLLQTLERSGKFNLPGGIGYYQILTVHGVTLDLVLTTFFILGFMLAAQSKTADKYSERKMGWDGMVWLLDDDNWCYHYNYVPSLVHKKYKIQ